jgi:tetratricopeptide (TPR) repeat protein
VFPGLLIAVAWSFRRGTAKGEDSFAKYLVCGSVGALLFLLLVDPSLGMPRDWDLMSLTLLFPILLLVRSIVRPDQKLPGGLIAGYGLISLAMTVAFMGTVLYRPSAEARMLDMLRYNEGKNNTGWGVLSNYYQQKGESAKVDAITAEMRQFFPDEAVLSEAHLCLSRGDFKRALSLAEGLYRKDPNRSDYVQVYGTALWKSGDLEHAISLYRDAIALRPWYVQLKNDLGQVYIKAGKYDEALAVLKEGRAQDPTLHVVTESIALAFIYQHRYDSAMVQADLLLRSGDDEAGGHLVAMFVLITTGRVAEAREHYHRYIELGKSRGDYQNIVRTYTWLEHSDHP